VLCISAKGVPPPPPFANRGSAVFKSFPRIYVVLVVVQLVLLLKSSRFEKLKLFEKHEVVPQVFKNEGYHVLLPKSTNASSGLKYRIPRDMLLYMTKSIDSDQRRFCRCKCTRFLGRIQLLSQFGVSHSRQCVTSAAMKWSTVKHAVHATLLAITGALKAPFLQFQKIEIV
jgi:hypothetical protein